MSSTSGSFQRAARPGFQHVFSVEEQPTKWQAFLQVWIKNSKMYRVVAAAAHFSQFMLCVCFIIKNSFDGSAIFCLTTALIDLTQMMLTLLLRFEKPSVKRMFLTCLSFLNMFLKHLGFQIYDSVRKCAYLQYGYQFLKVVYLMHLLDFSTREFWFQNIPQNNANDARQLLNREIRTASTTPFKPQFFAV